jgi:hypothetical protein
MTVMTVAANKKRILSLRFRPSVFANKFTLALTGDAAGKSSSHPTTLLASLGGLTYFNNPWKSTPTVNKIPEIVPSCQSWFISV